MSLECGCDEGQYVEIPEVLSTSPGTLFCGECRQLIYPGTPYYRVRQWTWDEDGEEVDTGVYEVCEVCGDLAQALLERGFCWTYGDVRYDIQTLHEMETS